MSTVSAPATTAPAAPAVVMNPEVKFGGKVKLTPQAPAVPTTPGDPPPPHAVTVPVINAVPQTQLPYPPQAVGSAYLSNAVR